MLAIFFEQFEKDDVQTRQPTPLMKQLPRKQLLLLAILLPITALAQQPINPYECFKLGETAQALSRLEYYRSISDSLRDRLKEHEALMEKLHVPSDVLSAFNELTQTTAALPFSKDFDKWTEAEQQKWKTEALPAEDKLLDELKSYVEKNPQMSFFYSLGLYSLKLGWSVPLDIKQRTVDEVMPEIKSCIENFDHLSQQSELMNTLRADARTAIRRLAGLKPRSNDPSGGAMTKADVDKIAAACGTIRQLAGEDKLTLPPGPIDDSAIGAIDPVTETRLGKIWLQDDLQDKKLSANEEYIRVVNEIGHRILDAINDRPDLGDWEFFVVDSPVINAFSIAGGKIVVYTGAIELATINGKIDKGMLAGVIGHEIAHAKLRHQIYKLRDMNKLSWVLDNVDQIKEGGAKSDLTETEQKKFFELGRARFTREQEFEADEVGAFYAAVAGYGFDGNIRFSERYIDKNGDPDPTEYVDVRMTKEGRPLALDHPTDSERIAKMKEYQAQLLNIAGEFNWGSEMLQARNFEKATQCFRDVVKLFPKCFQAWNNLGIARLMRFLESEKPDKIKYQTDLVDYLADPRALVRAAAADDLTGSIACFREALRQSPTASGVRANLGTALTLQAILSSAEEKSALDESEELFDSILKKEPQNPQALNGKAIVLCVRDPKSTVAEELFSKAAALNHLPAQYNLARLRLDTGKEREGVAGLIDYLGKDPSSAWAGTASELLKAQKAEVPRTKASLLPHIDSVLNVKLDAKEADVLQMLKEPERREKADTSRDSSGEILWYDSLGIKVALSEDLVQALTIFKPGMPYAHALQDAARARAEAPMPEVAGVAVGDTVDRLEKKLGKPTQVSAPPGTTEELRSYGDDRVRIDFRSNWNTIVSVTVSKKT
jgi:predicted Zn-dependent protease